MKFLLNGQPKEYDGDPNLPLLTYLREHEGIISAKDGCAPQAACGACAVQLDQKAVLSCVTPMKKVADAHVTTTEGMSEFRQNVFANAFVEKGGVQCGYCIPGIVMQANVLVDKNPEPSQADIEKALTPHLCRCTGYKKIVDSIQYAAAAIQKEEAIPTPKGNGRIGTRHPKYHAQDLVLGQHKYVDDVRMDGMAYGALKFSDHPRAIVKQINTDAAAALDGVIRIFSADDVPGGRYIGLIKQDWPLMVAIGETTRYVGDVLVGIVAKTDAIARQAVELVEVEYEVLEPLLSMHDALKPDAPLIHEAGNQLAKTVTSRGDLAQAKADAAFTAAGVFETQMIEHGYMEPEAAIAYQPMMVWNCCRKVRAFMKIVFRLLNCSACRWEKYASFSSPTGVVLAVKRI